MSDKLWTVTHHNGAELHRHSQILGEYCDDYTSVQLDGYELDAVDKKPIRAMFYWYGCGSYEGNGDAIMVTTGGLWGDCSMSHCSCYGPEDGIDGCEPSDVSLDALVSRMSRELGGKLIALVDRARDWNTRADAGEGER